MNNKSNKINDVLKCKYCNNKTFNLKRINQGNCQQCLVEKSMKRKSNFESPFTAWKLLFKFIT